MNVIPGILFCLGLGAVLGFWIEALTYDPHPGFYECKDCGPRFIDTARWWAQRGK